MSHGLLGDASLPHRLLSIDDDLAAEARARGCLVCGGPLHRADYPRKPRGADGQGVEFERRRSLCCGRETCRKRLTPASVRFLGRRVWLSVVVTLLSVAVQGLSASRARKLRAELGVSRRTLERWGRWWRESLPRTGWWRSVSGKFAGEVEAGALPRSLLERFAGNERDRLLSLLALMGPLSQSELMAARCAMGR